MKISRISSLVTPLTSAPLMCTRNSCGRFRIEIIAAPHRAPAIFRDQFLERLVEVVGIFQRMGDIGLAQHRFTDFQPLIVRFLVHGVSLSVVCCLYGRRYGVAAAPSRLRAMRAAGCGLPPGTGASWPPLCYCPESEVRYTFCFERVWDLQ